MELLVTLNQIENIDKYKRYGVGGVIAGTSLFSSRYKFNLNDLFSIKKQTVSSQLNLYISIDTMIEEKDKDTLKDYLRILLKMGVKGIYFTDLSVYAVAKELGSEDKLIYDPTTLMTNSLDANFYLNKGIGSVVLAREITYNEIMRMAKHTPNLEMQVAGYLKSATSKRKFLTNYFKYIGKDYDPTNKEHLKIVEETRDYALPIIENQYGTQIYTDYILLALKEYPTLKTFLKRAIIDNVFLSEDETMSILKAFSKVNEDNYMDVIEELVVECPECAFDTGYLYQKTNLTK